MNVFNPSDDESGTAINSFGIGSTSFNEGNTGNILLDMDFLNLNEDDCILDFIQDDIPLNNDAFLDPLNGCIEDTATKNEGDIFFGSSEKAEGLKKPLSSPYKKKEDKDKSQRKPDRSLSPPRKRRSHRGGRINDDVQDLQFDLVQAELNASMIRSAFSREQIRHFDNTFMEEPSDRTLRESPLRIKRIHSESTLGSHARLDEAYMGHSTAHLDDTSMQVFTAAREESFHPDELFMASRTTLTTRVKASGVRANRIDGFLLGSRTTLTTGLEQSRNILRAYLTQVNKDVL